jgi:hypothetical protein
MKNSYPFLYKKKERNEPAPLYVELVPPPPPLEKDKDSFQEEDSPGIIIIEIF